MQPATESRRILGRTTGHLHLVATGTALLALDFSLRIGSAQVDLLPDSVGLLLVAIGSIGLAILRGGMAYELLATIAAAIASCMLLAQAASFFLPTLQQQILAADPILSPTQSVFPLLICDALRRLSRDAGETNISLNWWRTEQFFAASWTVPATLSSILGPQILANLFVIWPIISAILVLIAFGLFLWSIRLQSRRFA